MTNLVELEEAFGTDRAIGLYYEVDGKRLNYDEFTAWADSQEKEITELDNWNCYMPDGSSAVVCTNYAFLVARRYPGRTRVVGYSNEDNPTASAAAGCEGHDFAIVDDRYLVDPWVKLVECSCARVAFDLQDGEDVVLVRGLYGPSIFWSTL